MGLVGEWERRCNADGLPLLIYETLRTRARQLELYRKGRRLEGDRWVRIPGQRIVTMARPGWSWHNHARAIDAVPWELWIDAGRPGISKKLDWTPFVSAAARRAWPSTLPEGDLELLDPRWRIMVRRADQLGLEWAGRWTRFREAVHWQNRGGLQLRDLAEAA